MEMINPYFSQAFYCDVTMARTTRLFLCQAAQRSETTPALPSVGKALHHAPLSRLATKPYEKCGLKIHWEVHDLYGQNPGELLASLFGVEVLSTDAP